MKRTDDAALPSLPNEQKPQCNQMDHEPEDNNYTDSDNISSIFNDNELNEIQGMIDDTMPDSYGKCCKLYELFYNQCIIIINILFMYNHNN